MAKFSGLVAYVDYPPTMLPKWQKHLPHKLHLQPQLPMKTTSYGEAWRAFRKQNVILVYVQPLITRLCPLHVHKHGFIVHHRFITINHWSAVHHDISLQRTSLQRYIVAWCWLDARSVNLFLFCFSTSLKNQDIYVRKNCIQSGNHANRFIFMSL